MNNWTNNNYNPIGIQKIIPKTPNGQQLKRKLIGFLFILLFFISANQIHAQSTVSPYTEIICGVEVDIVVQQPSCQSIHDGDIEVNTQSVTDDLAVTWLNANQPAEDAAPSLGPGLYLIELQVGTCVDTLEIELAYSDPIIAPDLEKVLCYPGGTVDLLENVSGGTGGFAISSIAAFDSNIDYSCDICPTSLEVSETTVFRIEIQDENGCQVRRLVYVRVLEPIAIERVESEPDRCEGDGVIQLINITGGGGVYKYEVNGVPMQQNDASFIGLEGGQEYKIVVIDQFGCTLETSIELPSDQYVRPEVAYNVEPASCFGIADAELSIASTGSEQLSGFTLNNATDAIEAGDVFTDLSAGRYQVFARFGEDCALELDEEVVIGEPEELKMEALTADASCGGNSDGEVQLLTQGGNANYQYRLGNSISPQASNLFTGLLAGEYLAYVEDEKGCQDSLAFSVENAPPPPITIDLTPTCPGDSSGIVIIESGKLFEGSLFYSLDSINWFRGDTITASLPAGDFSIYVLKVPGNCLYTVDTSMAEVEAPLLELSLQDISCPGGQDGALSISISGGDSTEYRFSLDGEHFQESPVFTELRAGAYTLEVQDEQTCLFSYDFNLQEPPAPAIQPQVTAVSCHGSQDGQLSIAVTGGFPPFQYALDGATFQEDSTFQGLSAGEHILVVQDATQCHFVNSIIVDEPDSIIAFMEVIPETCQNQNGVVAVQAFGGAAPYSYRWTTGDSSWLVGNLAAGNYSVSITDAEGCSTSGAATVEDLAGPIVLGDLDHSPCYGSANGKIDLSVIGGSGELVYAWSHGSYEEDQDSLLAGSYIVTVVDQKLCATTKSFTLYEPDPIQLSYQSGQYGEWWFINLQVEGGVAPYRYAWSTGEETEDLFGLATGTYTVTVTDDHDCEQLLEVDIQLTDTQEPDLEASLRVFPNPALESVRAEWDVEPPVLLSAFDLQGKLMQSKMVADQGTWLDIATWAPGVYVLQFRTPEGTVHKRLVKQ